MALLIYDTTGQLQFGALIEPSGEQIPLCGRSLVLGSSAADCDIVLEGDPTVRPRHCEIKRGGGRILLEALQGDDATLVNGQQAKQSELNDGDAVQIGQTKLTFSSARSNATSLPTAPPAPAAGDWYAEIGGQYQGPFSIEQLKEKIDARTLGPTDYIRKGPSGTPQPAGRTAELKKFFAPAASSSAPPTPAAQTTQPELSSAQSPELQEMLNSLPAAEDAPRLTEPKKADQPARSGTKEKKARKRSPNSRAARQQREAEKQAAAIEAALDDVLFSDEPLPEKVAPAASEPREETKTETTQSAAASPTAPTASSPLPAPPRSVATPPKKAKPFKPKKSKAKSSGSGESLFSHPKAKPALIGAAVVALICAFMIWPSSPITESHDEQLAALKGLSNELQAAVNGTPEEWTTFRAKAEKQAEAIFEGYRGRPLDPAGEELKGAARLLKELKPESEGEQGRADLVKKLLERAETILGV